MSLISLKPFLPVIMAERPEIFKFLHACHYCMEAEKTEAFKMSGPTFDSHFMYCSIFRRSHWSVEVEHEKIINLNIQ